MPDVPHFGFKGIARLTRRRHPFVSEFPGIQPHNSGFFSVNKPTL